MKNITLRKLDQLRILADWQLVEAGYDPAEVTAACLAQEEIVEAEELNEDELLFIQIESTPARLL